MGKAPVLVSLLSACSLVAWTQNAAGAQNAPPAAVPAQMVVTLGHHYGHVPPVLTKNDLIVQQEHAPLTITNLTPLRGDQAAIELFVLVDHCSTCEATSKFEELRKFIASQPSSTAVGVAYIKDGWLEIAQQPTPDRDRAIQALSLPAGSKPSSPFGALADLAKGWKQDSCRHVVLMISNGMDPAAAEGQQDASAEAAIDAAQHAGVTVYAIYHPSADYPTADYSKIYSGQVLLAHVAVGTGGEAYFLGFGPLPSLAPFLADITDHLANQYSLEFLANPAGGPGALEQITVSSQIPDLELMTPTKAWVPGTSGSAQKRVDVPGKRR